MTEPIYIPLKPGTKQPAVKGWAEEGYQGVAPEGRVGLRADGLVIVDCDTEEAYRAWMAEHPATYTVSTPNGTHLYYSAENPEDIGPSVKPLPGTDIRAGRGSFVVAPPTDGYSVAWDADIVQWDNAWLPRRSQSEVLGSATDEWDSIPVGQQNSTLTAVAGTLRRQGASAPFIYAVLQQLREDAIEDGDTSNPWTNEDLKTIARSVARYEPDPDTTFLIEDESAGAELALDGAWPGWRLSTMTMPPPPEWLWQRYLPKGRLVLIDGAEGIGKGLFCVYLAMLVAASGKPVLWASTEDDPEEDIQRRLKAAGWGLDTHADITFLTKDPRFPTHTEEIEGWIEEEGFGLFIVDPGRSFLVQADGSPVQSYNDEAQIRPGLEALNRMAKRTGCTVPFVHHWNKNAQSTIKLRQGGSGAFGQVVRHRVTLAWHGPTDGGQGAFEVSKSNIAPTGGVHSYMVDANVKYDTAVLGLGVPMPEFADLDAWMKDVTSDGSIEIERGPDVRDYIESLPAGAKIDPVMIAAELGTSVAQVDEALLGFDGIVRRASGKVLVRAAHAG